MDPSVVRRLRQAVTRVLLTAGVLAAGAVAGVVALPNQAARPGTPTPDVPQVAVAGLPDGGWPVGAVAGADETACAITRDELEAWRASRELLVVDVRPSREFERVRIPGSVNFPLRELRTKLYLKDRRLLLVDRGYRGRELVAACRSMRASGFRSVRVLPGGLEAWRSGLGPLAGEGFTAAALDRVGPAALESGLRRDEWLVVDVTDAGAATELFRTANHVPFDGGVRFVSRLGKAMAADGDAPGRLVVLVDGDEKRHEAIKQAIGREWPEYLYFLDGGREAYQQYRAQQEKIISSTARGCTLSRCGSP